MAIRVDRNFPFFCVSLLGLETVRVIDREVELEPRLPGYYVDEDSMRAARLRNVQDILGHSIREHFGDPEVDKWLEDLGGMRRLDMMLTGAKEYRQYRHDCAEVEAETGFRPLARGERQHIDGVDSATDYDSYAVQVHRELLTKQAFGEIREDDRTNPSWEGHESNPTSTWVGGVQRITKPFWWSNIYMGRFRVGNRTDGSNGLVQLETSSGKDWVLDIRISKDGIGELPFRHITAFAQNRDMSPWSEMEDHPLVRELINRFYNDPSTLTWKKIGTGDKARWAAGMETPKGSWIWTPLTHSSSKTMDYWRENEGKEQERFYCRAIYWNEWVIAYKKSKTDEHINVRMYKECPQTGWLSLWKDQDYHYTEWGSQKKKLLASGGKDAYFGKPWKAAEYQRRDTQYAEL